MPTGPGRASFVRDDARAPAIIGGLGASLLPAMQSLIHGNFEGSMQRRAYALVGAAAAIAAALLGLFNGFRMTRLPDPKPSSSAEGMVPG